jgi:glutamine amidotransferase
LQNALIHLDTECRIVSDPEVIAASDRLILPGVGSYAKAMSNIEKSGMRQALEVAVLHRGVPFLGICLGMQLLSDQGEEGGVTNGLGWIPGHVIRISQRENVKVPHIGFNTARFSGNHDGLIVGLGDECDFYFLHSYHFVAKRQEDVIGVCDYGSDIVCAVRHENIVGVQFHPEKSQSNGLQLLLNFIRNF